LEDGSEAEPQIKGLLSSLNDVRSVLMRKFVAGGWSIVLCITVDRSGSAGLSLDAEITRLLGALSVQLAIDWLRGQVSRPAFS
jgi:hypothetical protein